MAGFVEDTHVGRHEIRASSGGPVKKGSRKHLPVDLLELRMRPASIMRIGSIATRCNKLGRSNG